LVTSGKMPTFAAQTNKRDTTMGKKKVYSLAVSSHVRDIDTEVGLYGTLAEAQTAMKAAYEGNLEQLDPLHNHYEFSIGEMDATIRDHECEEIYLDWTIEGHEDDLGGDAVGKTVYVATNAEKHCGGEEERFLLGVFTSLKGAQDALERQFKDDLACLDTEDEDAWTKRGLDGLGSFTYELDENEYYTYEICERDLED